MLLLQFGAAAAFPSADAVLDAERVGLPLHIESPHSETCPSNHDHLFCQVVRSLAAVSATPRVGATHDIMPTLVGEALHVARIDAELRPSLRGPTAPRPPPLG